MTLIETLVIGIGASVAKATLKLWLEDYEIAAEVGGSVPGILAKVIPDLLSRNSTNRTLERIQDLSADSINKMLRKEASEITDERLKLISNAAGDTLSNTPIDLELLVALNLDKDRLVEYFLERTGGQGGNPALAGRDSNNDLFPEAEQAIYRRILSHASQLIVDLSSSFPKFDVEVGSELLQRTESIAEQVIDGMNRVVVEQGDAFEADYRNACVRRWDQLELFGVDLNETNRRYNLSAAYVTLMVERLGAPTNADDEDIRDSMQADAALAKYDRLFVRGSAGSGKTTLLQWFAVFAAARRLDGVLSYLNNCIPFLIKLRNFAESELPAPQDFPKEASTALFGNMPAGWVHEKLKDGNGLVLVDGLDEVAEARRNDVRRWLNDLTAAFPKSRFIITSRPHAAEEGWLDSSEFVDSELQDMSREDIHEFIDHWHAAVAESTRDENDKADLVSLADSLKSKLSKNASIYRLATSPLLCALLSALHRQRVQNLPSDRIELYKLCIEMFMRRDEERKIDATDYIELTNRQKENLLQNFAWWMIRNEKTTATPGDAAECFQRYFDRLNHPPPDGDGFAVVRLFLQRIGILRKLSHSKVDFPHRTFQEYLAAKAATEEDDLGILVKNAHDDQWQEVVILAAGLISEKRASNFITDLLERADSDAKYNSVYLVAVAALDLVVASEKDSKVNVEVADRLEKIVPPKNLTAAKQLAVAGDLVVPHLLQYQRMNTAEACAAVRTLALIGSDAAYNALALYANDIRQSVQGSLVQSYKFSKNPDRYKEKVLSKIVSYSIRDPKAVDLQNLVYLTNLTSLTLEGAQAIDLDIFTSLPNLTSLCLKGAQITNLGGLASLSGLISLELSGTILSDVNGLERLTSLTSLDLDGTLVSDVSGLAGLTNLNSLRLFSDHVSDVSALASLNNLTSLILICHHVRDVSCVGSLTKLTSLTLNLPQVSDVSCLGSLTSLKSLRLRGALISDVSRLASLVNLTSLELWAAKVSDVSCLANMRNLTSLDLTETQVEDVSDLASLTTLKSLSLVGTQVRDVSCLASLTSLTLLDLTKTQVRDMSHLTSLCNLTSLRFDGDTVE